MQSEKNDSFRIIIKKAKRLRMKVIRIENSSKPIDFAKGEKVILTSEMNLSYPQGIRDALGLMRF